MERKPNLPGHDVRHWTCKQVVRAETVGNLGNRNPVVLAEAPQIVKLASPFCQDVWHVYVYITLYNLYVYLITLTCYFLAFFRRVGFKCSILKD